MTTISLIKFPATVRFVKFARLWSQQKEWPNLGYLVCAQKRKLVHLETKMRVTLLSLWTSACLTTAIGLSLSSSHPDFPMQSNLTETFAGTNASSKMLNQSDIGL